MQTAAGAEDMASVIRRGVLDSRTRGRDEIGSGHRRALRRVAAPLLLGVAPLLVLATMYRIGVSSHSLAVDFHYELYPHAKQMLSGGNPLPTAGFEPLIGGNPVWPPLALAVASPLTFLPLSAAEVVIAVLGLVLFAAALVVVGVRDWRVFGVCALWPHVAGEMRVSHLTPALALLAALAWRNRDRSAAPGVAVGAAIALKLLLWPLVVWLFAMKRKAAAVLAVALGAASFASILPYTGLGEYASALERVSRYFDQDAYTIYGLLSQLGVPDVPARLSQVVVGAALLILVWRLRSFSLAIAAALALSPIVWLDYFALALVPLAIVRPRFSMIWLLPLLTWGAPGTGLGVGTPFQIARVLVVFAVLLGLAARAEREGTTSPVGDRLDYGPRRVQGRPAESRIVPETFTS